MDIEITVWSVNASTPTERVHAIAPSTGIAEAKSSGNRSIFDPAVGAAVESVTVLRNSLELGDIVQGPAAITEDETTIIVPSSRLAIRQSDGCIDVVQRP
jgi:N-methylhydantoinase A